LQIMFFKIWMVIVVILVADFLLLFSCLNHDSNSVCNWMLPLCVAWRISPVCCFLFNWSDLFINMLNLLWRFEVQGSTQFNTVLTSSEVYKYTFIPSLSGHDMCPASLQNSKTWLVPHPWQWASESCQLSWVTDSIIHRSSPRSVDGYGSKTSGSCTPEASPVRRSGVGTHDWFDGVFSRLVRKAENYMSQCSRPDQRNHGRRVKLVHPPNSWLHESNLQLDILFQPVSTGKQHEYLKRVCNLWKGYLI
jgi:hypothetical protein